MPPPLLPLTALLCAAAILRLCLAAWVTGFIAVDDAYIHLRYGRQLVETGSFVYNAGEPVFGLTSPLYGLVAAAAVAVAGEAAAGLLMSVNIGLWTLAVLLAVQLVQPRLRLWIAALLSLAPVFVDNQLLGMETPLFALFLVGAVAATRTGRTTYACLAQGLAMVTRPEAILLAPWLLVALRWRTGSAKAAWTELATPLRAALLVGPGALWCAFSWSQYGHILPQSMAAKTGWNNDHYAGLTSALASLGAVPRLSFLPFLDHLPAWSHLPVSLGLCAAAAAASWCALRGRDRTAKLWMGFYGTILAFYLLGRGAIEASWYAVPPSMALALGGAPLLARLPRAWTGSAAAWALAVVLGVGSTYAAARRAPLLASYESAYGQCADMLDVRTNPGARVLVGEIGVFGWRSDHHIIDVGALVSPEVLPLKNAGRSLVALARELGATHIVVSTRALTTNHYPTVGPVLEGEVDRAWFEQRCRLLGRADNMLLYEILPA